MQTYHKKGAFLIYLQIVCPILFWQSMSHQNDKIQSNNNQNAKKGYLHCLHISLTEILTNRPAKMIVPSAFIRCCNGLRRRLRYSFWLPGGRQNNRVRLQEIVYGQSLGSNLLRTKAVSVLVLFGSNLVDACGCHLHIS